MIGGIKNLVVMMGMSPSPNFSEQALRRVTIMEVGSPPRPKATREEVTGYAGVCPHQNLSHVSARELCLSRVDGARDVLERGGHGLPDPWLYLERGCLDDDGRQVVWV